MTDQPMRLLGSKISVVCREFRDFCVTRERLRRQFEQEFVDMGRPAGQVVKITIGGDGYTLSAEVCPDPRLAPDA